MGEVDDSESTETVSLRFSASQRGVAQVARRGVRCCSNDLESVLHSGARSAFQLFSLSRSISSPFNETPIRPIAGLHRALFAITDTVRVSVTRQYGHHPRHVEAREARQDTHDHFFVIGPQVML